MNLFNTRNNRIEDQHDSQIKKYTSIISLIVVSCCVLFLWSFFASLDEVTTGQGKVITWNRSQIIQTRDGGAIEEILVREGDTVVAGQKLAALDSTRFLAGYNEIDTRVKALAVSIARLQAEITSNTTKPNFLILLKEYQGKENITSDAVLLQDNKVLIDHELSLLSLRRKSLEQNLTGLQRSLSLAQEELKMIQPLVKHGAVSQVEELRLKREENELQNKIADVQNRYYEQAKEELVKKKNELDSIYYQLMQRKDQLSSTIITSPVKGVVKDVKVTTIGGVLEPGGKLMEVVPSEDQLLIEVKINPRDIAFIHPNQTAIVKISAYESSIYGTMKAVVERISPDTLQDNTNREQYYYQVYVRTDKAVLETKDGKLHEIVPGMLATVDIQTGSKTVFEYLMKPLNKAKEALRER